MQKKNPRIAILLHGTAGTADKYGTGSNIDVSISCDHFSKHIKGVNENVDVFMHSWSEDRKEKLIELYEPKLHYFEPQLIFDFEYAVGSLDGPGGESNVWVDGKFKGLDNLRFHGLFSRWYSAKAANNLRLVYEKQKGFEYDFVMLTRYDLAYNVDFDFSNFSKEKFYVIPPLSLHSTGDIHHGMNDLWFVTDSEKMTNFLEMYEWIKTLKHFPHKYTHSHFLSLYFLAVLGYQEKIDYFGEERPWERGLEGEMMGPSPLVRHAYELREFTADDAMGDERERIRNVSKKSLRW